MKKKYITVRGVNKMSQKYRFDKDIISLICFVGMDFSEQSLIKDEALICEVQREAHFKQNISTIVLFI